LDARCHLKGEAQRGSISCVVCPLKAVVPQHQGQEVDRTNQRETGLSPGDTAAINDTSEPAITLTIRQKFASPSLPAGLDVIKEYDEIVDRPEARKQLERTNPGLVAARDKAVTEIRREKAQSRAGAETSLATNAG
jgi:hypothetical protein